MVFSKCSSCFPVVFVTVSSGHSDDIFSLNWLSKHICEVSCYQTNYYCCQWCAKHCTNCFVNLSLSHSLTVCIYIYMYIFNRCVGFLGGSAVNNPCACVGDTGSVPGSRRSPGEGNGNPLQYSCLENSIDRGAWWTTVHGSWKIQTQLKRPNKYICSQRQRKTEQERQRRGYC